MYKPTKLTGKSKLEQKQMIIRAMVASDGDVKLAAEALSCSPELLYRRLYESGMHASDYRPRRRGVEYKRRRGERIT